MRMARRTHGRRGSRRRGRVRAGGPSGRPGAASPGGGDREGGRPGPEEGPGPRLGVHDHHHVVDGPLVVVVPRVGDLAPADRRRGGPGRPRQVDRDGAPVRVARVRPGEPHELGVRRAAGAGVGRVLDDDLLVRGVELVEREPRAGRTRRVAEVERQDRPADRKVERLHLSAPVGAAAPEVEGVARERRPVPLRLAVVDAGPEAGPRAAVVVALHGRPVRRVEPRRRLEVVREHRHLLRERRRPAEDGEQRARGGAGEPAEHGGEFPEGLRPARRPSANRGRSSSIARRTDLSGDSQNEKAAFAAPPQPAPHEGLGSAPAGMRPRGSPAARGGAPPPGPGRRFRTGCGPGCRPSRPAGRPRRRAPSCGGPAGRCRSGCRGPRR